MSRVTTRRVGVLVALVLALAAGSALAGATTSPVVAQQNNSTNTTVHHEHPDSVSEDGSEADVRRWLGDRMSSLLEQSAVNLSQGEYETARSLLGEEYQEYFAKYVDVAGDTQGQDAESAARALNETREEQREYVSLVEEYRATYDAYQAAKTAGNETRARQLARELLRLSNQLDGTSANLTAFYQQVGNATNTDVSQPTEQLNETTANITQQQTAVTRAEFEPTTLTLQNASSSASYTDPLRISGRLTSENRSLPDSVVIAVADQSHEVALTEDGTFTLAYHPTAVPVGEQNLSVQYLPYDASLFLGSNATTTADIGQTTPTVTVETNRSRGGFNDTVQIQGTVRVNESGVQGVPVRLAIDGQSLDVVETNASGVYATSLRLPANVTANASALTATVAYEDRAIGPASAQTPFTVVETATDLTIAADRRTESAVVSGRLTAGGSAVPDAAVRVFRNGTRVATVTTNATGGFNATAAIPANASAASLRVEFSGAGTNLAGASASTVVTVPRGGSPLSVSFLAMLGVVLAAGLGSVGVWYRRRTRTPDDAEPAASVDDTGIEDEEAAASASGDSLASLLDDADSVDVRRVFVDVRRALGPVLSADDPGRTHWEFATAVGSELDSEIHASVETLADAYEQVVFADADLDDAERAAAREAAVDVREWVADHDAASRDASGGEGA